MKYVTYILIGLLLISLTFNMVIIGKINRFEERFNSISQSQNDMMWRVDSQSNQVQIALDDFRREQSWISRIDMTIQEEKIEEGLVNVHFVWQLKELASDAEVLFHYSLAEADYRSVKATEVAEGLFEVSISIEVSLQPEWYHSTSYHRDSAQWDHIELEEEYVQDGHVINDISYYVTVKNKDGIKSSEIEQTNISHIGANHYGLIETYLSKSEKGYSVTVSRPHGYDQPVNTLEEVFVLTYNKKELIFQEMLERRTEDEYHEYPLADYFQLYVEDVDYDNLVIKIVYSNGKVFEREIYSK
ncbi:MAG: hypothetical protein LRY71_15275 [Bacillaceae bacterium]|nr:hypothetical protein [Bacillaceae bacterium]